MSAGLSPSSTKSRTDSAQLALPLPPTFDEAFEDALATMEHFQHQGLSVSQVWFALSEKDRSLSRRRPFVSPAEVHAYMVRLLLGGGGEPADLSSRGEKKMPRIRSIHPSQWTDEDFVSCSQGARLLLLGLKTEADDRGAFEWRPISLKMRLMPADTVDIDALLTELEQHRLIARYEVDGVRYGLCMVWGQNPRRPHYRYPAPPSSLRQRSDFAADVGNDRALNEPVPDNGGNEPALTETIPASSSSSSSNSTVEQMQIAEREGAPAGAKISLSQDFVIPQDWLVEARTARTNASLAPVNLGAEAEKFRNRFAGKLGAGDDETRRRWIDWALKARADTAAAPVAEAGAAEPGAAASPIVHRLGEPGDRLRERLGSVQFRQWFAEVTVESLDGGVLRLAVSRGFDKTWLSQHYEAEILAAWRVQRVEFVIRARPAGTTARASSPPADASSQAKAKRPKRPDPKQVEALLPVRGGVADIDDATARSGDDIAQVA